MIVVDDGCPSTPDEMVRAFFPDAVILRQANAGPAAARNYGVRAATNDIVAFLDADDRWTGHALAVLAKGFRDAPQAEVVQGHVRRFETSASGKERRLGGPYLGFNVGALLVRRDTLIACGLFDESLRAERRCRPALAYARARRAPVADPGRGAGIPAPSQFADGGSAAARAGPRRPGELDPPPAQQHGPAPGHDRRRCADAAFITLFRRDGGPERAPLFASGTGVVRRQSAAPAEIVAIVGASEDGTLSYLEAQPDIRVVRQAGSGLAEARNQGIEEARGGTDRLP